MPGKSRLFCGAVATVLLCLGGVPIQAGDIEAEALPGEAAWLRTQPRAPLWIISKSARCWRFNTWVARTPEEFSRGLMYVQHLDDDGGMFFAMHAEREISMWMRNTYISLDILFADMSGEIITIYENTTPLSLDYITSEEPAFAVLELPAGAVAKRNISVGDRLRHAHFGNSGCHDQN